jgi:hypothetical protein
VLTVCPYSTPLCIPSLLALLVLVPLALLVLRVLVLVLALALVPMLRRQTLL